MTENSLRSLEEAACLSPTNAFAFARRAQALASSKQPRIDNFRPAVDELPNADWFSRYATNLAPSDPEIRLIRESIAQRIPSWPGLAPTSKKWQAP